MPAWIYLTLWLIFMFIKQIEFERKILVKCYNKIISALLRINSKNSLEVQIQVIRCQWRLFVAYSEHSEKINFLVLRIRFSLFL